MLCEVERKKCHLDPLTRPSLIPDVKILPVGEEFLLFTLVPFFTNFTFKVCFELGTEDLIVLIEDLLLLITIRRTLS